MDIKAMIVEYWLEVLLGAIVTGIVAVYRHFTVRIAKQNCEHMALRSGTLALLRSEIIRNYDTYMTRKHIPIYAMENVLDLYNAYHTLGGNGTVTKLIEELKELPSKPKEVVLNGQED